MEETFNILYKNWLNFVFNVTRKQLKTHLSLRKTVKIHQNEYINKVLSNIDFFNKDGSVCFIT